MVCLISSSFFPVGATSKESFFRESAKTIGSPPSPPQQVVGLAVVKGEDDVKVLDEVEWSSSSYFRRSRSVIFSRELMSELQACSNALTTALHIAGG
jgi:hypothetical protein